MMVTVSGMAELGFRIEISSIERMKITIDIDLSPAVWNVTKSP